MRPEKMAEAVGLAIRMAVAPLKQEIETLRATLAAAEARAARDHAALVALQKSLGAAAGAEPPMPARDVH